MRSRRPTSSVTSEEFGGLAAAYLTPSDLTSLANFQFHAPTDLNLSSTIIAENQPSGSLVGAFSTVDVGSGDTFTYGLVSGAGSTNNASFTVDASGNLKTAASFNFETKNSYSILVRTTDAGGLWFEKQFTITVTDVNEAPTAATGGAYSIHESNSLTLDASGSSDPDTLAGDSVASYLWDLG